MTATRHISRALSSLRNALPLPTNTLLYFPLADQRPDYLWPVQAQHRYGAARLLFANHRLDLSSLCLAMARYCLTMHSLCVSTSLRFTSCIASQRSTIASPIDASRCLCFSLPHHAPLLLCALACVNACWRVLARVASARRFYAFPSPCNPKHYLACAFPLFSYGSQCSIVLLRCLDSLSVADTVHIIAVPFPSIALQCRATPGLALL